jgi:hypothetical protein
METNLEALADARRYGRLEAEAFDRALHALEQRERDERLTRLTWGADEDFLAYAVGPSGTAAMIAQLERDVERLARFHDAVLRSRGWRWLQRLRRLAGRAW